MLALDLTDSRHKVLIGKVAHIVADTLGGKELGSF